MAHVYYNRFELNPETKEEFNENFFEALKEVYQRCDEIEKMNNINEMSQIELLEFAYKVLRITTNFSDINNYLDFEFSVKQDTALADNLIRLRETFSHSCDLLNFAQLTRIYDDIIDNLNNIKDICTKYFPKEILIKENSVKNINELLSNYFPNDDTIKNKYLKTLNDEFKNKTYCYNKKFAKEDYEQALTKKKALAKNKAPIIKFNDYPRFKIDRNLSNINIYTYELAKLFNNINYQATVFQDIPGSCVEATAMQTIILAESIQRIKIELDKNFILQDPTNTFNSIISAGNLFTHSSTIDDSVVTLTKNLLPALNNQMRQHLPDVLIRNPEFINNYKKSVLKFIETSHKLTPQQILNYKYAIETDFLSKELPTRIIKENVKLKSCSINIKKKPSLNKLNDKLDEVTKTPKTPTPTNTLGRKSNR